VRPAIEEIVPVIPTPRGGNFDSYNDQ